MRNKYINKHVIRLFIHIYLQHNVSYAIESNMQTSWAELYTTRGKGRGKRRGYSR